MACDALESPFFLQTFVASIGHLCDSSVLILLAIVLERYMH